MRIAHGVAMLGLTACDLVFVADPDDPPTPTCASEFGAPADFVELEGNPQEFDPALFGGEGEIWYVILNQPQLFFRTLTDEGALGPEEAVPVGIGDARDPAFTADGEHLLFSDGNRLFEGTRTTNFVDAAPL